MNKTTLLLIILICYCLAGCHSGSDSPGDLKKIDMNQAFSQSKSIKLSDLVKSVEIVQFYPPEDTYFVNARSFAVGNKYILIADDKAGVGCDTSSLAKYAIINSTPGYSSH